MSKFYLCSNEVNQGFTMTYANGVTVSVRWGNCNYSDGKDTAEVAAMAPCGNFVCVPGYEGNWASDQVIGWLCPNEVTNWMFAASTMKITPESLEWR